MARTGKHALVTGGGSGIGVAIARALSGAGWQVTITGRNKEKLEAAAKAISGAHIETCDVTDADSVRVAVQAAAKAHGPVQLLVNNAGGVTSASFEKTSLESFRQTIDLNLMGVVHGIHAVLPQMKEGGWGRIVNIASTAGLTGYRYVSAYVAAKVIALAVKTIAKSSGRTQSEALATFTAANPQGRLVKPEEVAAAVLWLASDEAAAVNGIALPIAGGEVT